MRSAIFGGALLMSGMNGHEFESIGAIAGFLVAFFLMDCIELGCRVHKQ